MHFFSSKDMKLQAVVIFTSFKMQKFTPIVGHTVLCKSNVSEFRSLFLRYFP